jgi:hypothetical protein
MSFRTTLARSAFLLGMSHVKSALKFRDTNPERSEEHGRAFLDLVALAPTDLALASVPPASRVPTTLVDISHSLKTIWNARLIQSRSIYANPALDKILNGLVILLTRAQSGIAQALADGAPPPELLSKAIHLYVPVVRLDVPLPVLSFRMKQFAAPAEELYAFRFAHPIVQEEVVRAEFSPGNCRLQFEIGGIERSKLSKLRLLLQAVLKIDILRVRGSADVVLARFAIPLKSLADHTEISRRAATGEDAARTSAAST